MNIIFKNLFRRKSRTFLTIVGISVGVAAIIGLGALADGLESGYGSMLSGSQADLVLSQPNSFDLSYSVVDEDVGRELAAFPEVAAVSGMIQGFSATENSPFFFVFGYPENSFILNRFQVISGDSIFSRSTQRLQGKPIMLGSAAAEALDKSTGDALRLGGAVFRIVGIYQTGDAFEDSGAVLPLREAQEALGKPRQVSLYYIQLKDPSLAERLTVRIERLWPDLSLGTTQDLADKQLLGDMLKGYVWAISGMAIFIGGIGMMNSQLMSVLERTREIGVLRSVGWRRGRVLLMILGESLVVCLLGGLAGLAIAYISVGALTRNSVALGAGTQNITVDLILQALVVVLVLGLVGGLYPAWRAANLQPIEALRYEGGTGGGKVKRLPFGGLAIQGLWQRSARTALTIGVIALTVGAIVVLDAILLGVTDDMTQMATGADAEIVLRQADVADTSLSTIDEAIGERIAAMPEVKSIAGTVLTASVMPDGGFFIIQGYAPNEFAIRRFQIIGGERLTSNHQIILGEMMAESLNKTVGESIDVNGIRYRIVGIYRSSISWEELGGVVTLRDAQSYAGKPRKVMLYMIKLDDPQQAVSVAEAINQKYPDIHAALSGEFVEQLPDMQNSDAIMSGISFLSIIVGGVGVLNTMLMSVLERTREIGVLRALGWRRRRILSLILKEAFILGFLGGMAGITVAFILAWLIAMAPVVGDSFSPIWTVNIFLRALLVSFALGILGGLYPAMRATRLQPIEALRYE